MSTIPKYLREEAVRALNRAAKLTEDTFPSDARYFEQTAARIAPRQSPKRIAPRERIKKTSLPFKTTRQLKRARASAHKESTSSIRPAVFERAGDRCEAWHPGKSEGSWHRCEKKATIWDHWMSGTGRRRQKQAVETTWALCDSCNFARTEKIPNIEWWNESHRVHCELYGYLFEPHIEHSPVSPRPARTA